MRKRRIATLILAAGSSKRMGQAKLLMKYKGEKLIRQCIQTVLGLNESDVFVVTGAYKDKMEAALIDFSEITLLHNKNHLNGMGSSIAHGVRSLLNKNYTGILVVLPDQILLETKHLVEILDLSKKHPKAIILSDYGESSGPPTFFPATLFSQLLDLEGDKGAKQGIIDRNTCHAYIFPLGIFDIDNMEDCKKFDISD